MALMEIRSATITEKGQIVIPKQLREKEGFKTGSKVSILAFEDHLEVRPLKEISESMECMLLSEEVLAKEWNTPEEDKAWAYLKEEVEKLKKKKKC